MGLGGKCFPRIWTVLACAHITRARARRSKLAFHPRLHHRNPTRRKYREDLSLRKHWSRVYLVPSANACIGCAHKSCLMRSKYLPKRRRNTAWNFRKSLLAKVKSFLRLHSFPPLYDRRLAARQPFGAEGLPQLA